jgi:CMP-N-acetylneuraminic acid synthetase
MQNYICFIKARNSSTRLKGKYIAPFRNGNLITHTIEQAKLCNVFDRIILSSNDNAILDMGIRECVETHFRDDKHDQIIDVIRHAIPEINVNNEDTFGLLLVTCPLRNLKDIREAHKIFEENGRVCSVVSVKKNENPIQMSWRSNEDGDLFPVMEDEYNISTRKQDHYNTYCYNDAIIFDTVKNFMKLERNLFGDTPIPYLMPWERSIAIDYEFQLKIAQCLGGQDDEI